MAALTAEQLNARYGAELAQPPLCDLDSPYLLHKALIERPFFF